MIQEVKPRAITKPTKDQDLNREYFDWEAFETYTTLSRRTGQHAIANNELEVIRVGRRTLMTKQAIDDWLAKFKVKTAAAQ